MSKKTRIPVSTLFDRLKVNEDDLILRHTSLIDFNKLGYHTRAKIMLKVDREQKDTLKQHLMINPAVNNICRINNGFDFLIEGIFRHVKDMEEFIDRLEGKFNITERKTFFVIEELKREAFLSDPQLISI
ncbi:Lrp/AsnC ligand binding domain-containing protein [Nanoarchaeota archaeon]